MKKILLMSLLLALNSVCAADESGGKLRALVVSGQMNKYHNMELMNQVLERYLVETGLFEVTQLRTPPAGSDMAPFAPDWSAYDVVVLNYDGDAWPETTRKTFEAYMQAGGGLVSVHSTDNAFPDWQAFLDMTALGGWGGRDETWGPAVYWRDGGIFLYSGPGGTFHPPKHDYPVTIRNVDHPVTRGLPPTWMHAHDELYSRLRGPARNMDLLATGFADPAVENASGEHEAAIFTVRYGAGRIFHTTLGHINRDATEPPESVRCIGFAVTFQRGAEWAASGAVTQAAPDAFPGPGQTLLRD
jgi:hypothetical protein